MVEPQKAQSSNLLDVRDLSHAKLSRPQRGTPDPETLRKLLAQLDAGGNLNVGNAPKASVSVAIIRRAELFSSLLFISPNTFLLQGMSGLTQRANRAVTAQAALHAEKHKLAWKRGFFKTTLMLEFGRRDESKPVCPLRNT